MFGGLIELSLDPAIYNPQSNHFLLFEPNHIFPGIAEHIDQDLLGMLAKLRSRRLRIRRRFAEDKRRAHDLSRAPGWMVVVHDVVIGKHLLVFREVIDAVDYGIDEVPTGFENLHPFVSRLGGK